MPRSPAMHLSDAARARLRLVEVASRPLSPADGPANAITDAMNAAVPWLWWPLGVPDANRPLGVREDALYALHGVVILAVLVRAARVPVPRGPATALGAASWLWFTGAWNRRAEALNRGSARPQSLR